MSNRFRLYLLAFSLFLVSPNLFSATKRDVPVEKFVDGKEAGAIFDKARQKFNESQNQINVSRTDFGDVCLFLFNPKTGAIKLDMKGRCEIPKLRFLSRADTFAYSDLCRHLLFMFLFESPNSRDPAKYIKVQISKVQDALREVAGLQREFTKEQKRVLDAIYTYTGVLASMSDQDLRRLVEIEKNNKWWKKFWYASGGVVIGAAVIYGLYWACETYLGDFNGATAGQNIETDTIAEEMVDLVGGDGASGRIGALQRSLLAAGSDGEARLFANQLVGAQQAHATLVGARDGVVRLRYANADANPGPFRGAGTYAGAVLRSAGRLANGDVARHSSERPWWKKMLLPPAIGFAGEVVASPALSIANPRVKRFVATAGVPLAFGILDYLRSDVFGDNLARVREEENTNEIVVTILRMIFGACYYNTWNLAPYAITIGVEQAYKISTNKANGIQIPLATLWENYIANSGLPDWTKTVFRKIKDTPYFAAFIIEMFIPIGLTLYYWHTFPELGRYLRENWIRYCAKWTMCNSFLKWGATYSPYMYAKMIVDIGSRAGILPMDVTGDYLESQKCEYLDGAATIIETYHNNETYAWDYISYHLAEEWQGSYDILECSWHKDIFEEGFSFELLSKLFMVNYVFNNDEVSYGFYKPGSLEDIVTIMKKNGFMGRRPTVEHGWVPDA